jgi:hypothetical protein
MIGPKSILWTFRQRWTKSTRVCRPSISSQTLESQTLLTCLHSNKELFVPKYPSSSSSKTRPRWRTW